MNKHLATSELNRMKVIKAAESVIQWIVNERQENAALAASIKDDLIRRHRNTLWARVFLKNTGDDVFWKSYCPKTDEYNDAEMNALLGWSHQLDACKRLLNIALASSAETIAITDVGYSYIKRDFDLQ